MGNSKLSVIIPTYNNAQLLKKLLKELIYQKQTYYPETEIIVVDDGSVEDMSCLDEYKEIKAIHKENGGVSSARNVALKLATGEFISFIDSDDFIEKDYLHIIYSNMRKDYDYCVYSWKYYVGENQNKIANISTMETEPILWNWAVWGYSYNRRILEGIYFDESLNVNEDIEWLRRVIKPDQMWKAENKPIYIYNFTNENSLSHRFNRGEISRGKGEEK